MRLFFKGFFSTFQGVDQEFLGNFVGAMLASVAAFLLMFGGVIGFVTLIGWLLA